MTSLHTMTIPQLLYNNFRRYFPTHAKSLGLVLVVVFIALNLLAFFSFDSLNLFSSGDWSSAGGSIPIDRRETSLLLSEPRGGQGQRLFKTSPTWIQEWFQFQRLNPELNAENYDVWEGEGDLGSVPSSSSSSSNEGGEEKGATRGSKGLKIDVVYTWVNGTDEALQLVKEQYEDLSPLYQSVREYEQRTGRPPTVPPPRGGRNALNRLLPDGSVPPSAKQGEAAAALRGGASRTTQDATANRFRDMDELKYSVRSVAQYAQGMFDRIHILTTEVDPARDEAQVPSWLNMEASQGVIELVHHDQIFEKTEDLPSFNSLSIESQIHHIPGVTDVFLYLNDDVFLGQPMSAADVWTPLYGFVFHMEPTLLVPPTPLVSHGETLAIGEWNSLQYSNHLLSKQFGARHRSYIAHVPHVLSAPMLHEIQTIWPDDIQQTASHRFRGEGEAKDIQVSFFMAHYVMERLRETQLESFWKYRLDANQDGMLDWEEREALVQKIERWNEVHVKNQGYYPRPPYNSEFSSFLNGSDEKLEQLGIEITGSSTYSLSGQDGYPFMLEYGDTSRGSQAQPRKDPYSYFVPLEERSCYFNLEFCLGPEFLSNDTDSNGVSKGLDMMTSTNIFQRLAFVEFHCGDCLLHILRQTGGPEPGLQAAFLPLEDKNPDAFKTVTSDLAKYNYVIADSDYSFTQLTEPFGSQRELSKIMLNRDTHAFFCINDNVNSNSRVVQQVQQIFHQFLENRFPIPSPWEKKN
ncbi:hypothetical protein EMPS_09103 [Entomortierella parvispora]|uniref:Stealth protein CR3 conserved region 3 domain-containing protein n=1 Tax=Entomortierella parvispora TaxID=205924 RepID=A0A9P3HHC7_9FUNG|nr:hypothetical protein EMPS_09103 [Entomortierella parvispora]